MPCADSQDEIRILLWRATLRIFLSKADKWSQELMSTVPLRSSREKTHQGIISICESQCEKALEVEYNNLWYSLSNRPSLIPASLPSFLDRSLSCLYNLFLWGDNIFTNTIIFGFLYCKWQSDILQLAYWKQELSTLAVTDINRWIEIQMLMRWEGLQKVLINAAHTLTRHECGSTKNIYTRVQ